MATSGGGVASFADRSGRHHTVELPLLPPRLPESGAELVTASCRDSGTDR